MNRIQVFKHGNVVVIITKVIIMDIVLYLSDIGWTVRIYSALEEDDKIGTLELKKIFSAYPFVDLCNVTRVLELQNMKRPLFPMTWR